MRILQIVGDDVVASRRRINKSILALGNDRVPALFAGVVDVYRYDAAFRCVPVGTHVEHRAPVANERIFGVQLVDQSDHGVVDLWLARVVEIDEVDTPPDIGPLGDGDDQILAIIGDVAVEQPVGLVRAIIDQLVA